MNTITENAWITQAGFPAIVIMTDLGHRCGYVGVPEGHPLYGLSYSSETIALDPPSQNETLGKRSPMLLLKLMGKDIWPTSPDAVFDVHGGITYSDGHVTKETKEMGLWWFGFDCAHAGDAPAPGYKYAEIATWRMEGVHRTLEFCEAECESLAQQIKDKTLSGFRLWWRRVRHAITVYRRNK